MDCMEARALKSSLRQELALKPAQQGFLDDFLCGTGIGVVSGEEFSVDDLLDFSNGEVEEEGEERDSLSVSDRGDDDNNSNSSGFSGDVGFGPFLAGELAVPDDDLAELEWVSQFVHDSPSELSLLCPVSKEKTGSFVVGPEPRPALTLPAWFPPSFPVKARTKRSRTAAVRAWSVGSPLSESPSSSSSSSGSGFVFSSSAQSAELVYGVCEPPLKKQKKKAAGPGAAAQFQRRCSHCGVQKTPQWRAGPLGAKTLCNACGVRYKSGRLFPEYRPACSPTFSVEIHSNSHRKVLELRRRKEMGAAEPESGLTQMVHGF